MCRVCQKRPEIPEERHGRCEACVKAGRIALRFRLAPVPAGGGWRVKAGETSPRALRQRWLAQLRAYTGQPASRAHLGLHEVEMIVARERLESIRVAPDLAGHAPAALRALQQAAERTDASW